MGSNELREQIFANQKRLGVIPLETQLTEWLDSLNGSRICYGDEGDWGAMADPVDLSAYLDKNGFIDVQTLTCAQLANALTAWYNGPRAQALSRLQERP